MADVAISAWSDGQRPEPTLTVSEWSDEFRMLSGGAEPGRWRTDRTPYLREPADKLSASDPTQEVIVMKGTQLGFSELLCNWAGYVMEHVPGPMLLVQTGAEAAKRFSSDRIERMIQDTPALSELAAKSMDRTAETRSTILLKKFKNGGILALTGANTSTGLRSMPVRYLGMDEVDTYPGDVDSEGHPVELAKERTSTFTHRRKIFMLSSPKVRGTSKIEAEFETTDQRYYFVPCQGGCGEKFVIKWGLVRWDNRDPSTVRVECPACGFAHREHHKPRMLRGGEWRPTAISSSPLRVGYHLSGLYSPWKTWEERVAGFLAAGNDPTKMKPWVNSVLGETWVEKGDAPEWERLYERREATWQIGTIPAGGLVLTAGVDVQRDRVEASIWAWGTGFESWLVDHVIFDGSPEKAGVLDQVESLLARRWPHADGHTLRIERLAIDTGDGVSTPLIYRWCRRQDQMRVLAIKGVAAASHPVTVSDVDVTDQSGRRRDKLKLWKVNVSLFKGEFYGWLKLPAPIDEDGEKFPPGYVHLPMGTTASFAQQLCAEQLVSKMTRGYVRQEWQQTGRNESLDTRVYSRAALYVLGADSGGDRFWADARRILRPAGPAQAAPPRPQRPQQSGWMSDFGRLR